MNSQSVHSKVFERNAVVGSVVDSSPVTESVSANEHLDPVHFRDDFEVRVRNKVQRNN
jgi:hypothetical protein